MRSERRAWQWRGASDNVIMERSNEPKDAAMSKSLVEALHVVAERLEQGAPYQWGHMGQCNCGHLAQVLTDKTAAQIHQSAIACQTGEWSEFANDYCGHTGSLIDDVFEALMQAGLTRHDIMHLENLSDPQVLAVVGRPLVRHDRDDAVAYTRALARRLAGG